MKIRNLILFGLLAIVFSACTKDDDAQDELDDQIIQDYINQNSIDAEAGASGLYYVINDEGSGGEHPSLNAVVEVLYVGQLTNGNVFDETTNSPVSFPLQNLIEGWKIGIPLIKKGGNITLIIPSRIGYGSAAHYGIPANSVLVFDITLVNFSE